MAPTDSSWSQIISRTNTPYADSPPNNPLNEMLDSPADTEIQNETTVTRNSNAVTFSLYGTGIGARPDVYFDMARAVYPVWDGTNPMPDPPASYDTAATEPPEDFPNWHSAHQISYLKAIAGNSAPQVTVPLQFLGADNSPIAAYQLSSDETKVYNLVSMSLTDFARLSETEQAHIWTNLTTIQINGTSLATMLGLTATSSTSIISDLDGLISSYSGSLKPNGSGHDGDVFAEEIKHLKRQVESSHAVSVDKVEDAIKDIAKRYDRVAEFYSKMNYSYSGIGHHTRIQGTMYIIHGNGHASVSSLKNTSFDTGSAANFSSGAYSTDGGQKVSEGYESFMVAERAILTAQNRREAFTRAAFFDPTLDVPNLINQLQLLYSDEAQALSDSETEVIRQLHKLLQDYAIMQQLVAKQKSFYDSDEKRRFMNVGAYYTTNSGNGEEKVDEKQQINDAINIPGEYFALDHGSVNQYRANGTLLYSDADPSTNISGAPDPSDNTPDDGWTKADADNYLIARSDVPLYHWVLLSSESSDLYNIYEDWLTHEDIAGIDDISGPNWNNMNDTWAWSGNRLSQTEFHAVSMFLDAPFMKGSRTHPIESLLVHGTPRPKVDIIDTQSVDSQNAGGNGSLSLMKRSEWDDFSTALSEMITLLNQQNQILQSNIENETKRHNRHFDLGNNALRKMHDMIMSIGRI